ncbi:MAG: hypothetical protein IJY26_04005, partial [Clostridia bacterium]|nr:hypothetical protein [Clostridia bacterium]
MKKTIKFILVVLTALCMLFAVACNSGDDNNNNNNQNQGGANAEVTRNEWHDALDFADITNYTCTLTYSKNGSDYTATVKRAGNDIYVTLADGSEQYFELVSGGAKKYVKANGSAEWTGE